MSVEPLNKTGAEVWAEALQRAGVDCVFAYPGATALPLFDALATHAPEIRLVLPRHEQGAAFMASGYARASGKPGVVLVTSGPGATNTVTAIADAWMDSIPLVVFSAQVALPLIGTDAFQESDITGITLPITKHSYLLKSADDIAAVVEKSFLLATTGRPGPIVVDIPIDVAQAYVKYHESPSVLPEMPRGYHPRPQADPADIARMIEIMGSASRPVIIAGGGLIAAGAAAELEEFACSRNIPVISTLMGRGAFCEDNPLWLGMAGKYGGEGARRALADADLVIALGTRLTERVAPCFDEIAPLARLIHVDIDAAELGKRHPTVLAINADLKEVLKCLLHDML